MNKLLRIFKHRWWDERDVRRAIDPAALARLQAQVHSSETRHSGEIRISIEAGLPLSYLLKSLSARARAITLFGKLRVWDTEHNNGVLIYLLLAERSIEIVADRGMARRVSGEAWQALTLEMSDSFRAGQFEAGLSQTIAQIDALLCQFYPLAPGTHKTNELPDDVDLR